MALKGDVVATMALGMLASTKRAVLGASPRRLRYFIVVHTWLDCFSAFRSREMWLEKVSALFGRSLE